MPCAGPSQEYAYAEGDKATEEILHLLKEKYGVSRRDHWFGDLPKQWDTLESWLRGTIRELIWTAHAGDF